MLSGESTSFSPRHTATAARSLHLRRIPNIAGERPRRMVGPEDRSGRTSMARNVTADVPRLRWRRALIAALAAEFVLILITVALFPVVTNPSAVLNWVIPPASLLVFTAA